MAFCSLDKSFSDKNYTVIENTFIKNYLPEADGMAVKVYLYGLYLTQNGNDEISAEDLSKFLDISLEKLISYFKYWQDFDLVTVISEAPLTVKYLSFPKHSKPRAFKAEKYTDFSISLQSLLPNRMITPSEFTEYYDLMESLNLKPEALLMIIKYCVDNKGENISYKYISATAKNLALKNITTVESLEKEFSDYRAFSSDLAEVFKTLKIKRKPTVDDMALYNGWINDGYDFSSIIYLCNEIKKKDLYYLNGYISNLKEKGIFSLEEIQDFNAKRSQSISLTKKICSALSYKCEVLDTFIETYLSAWQQIGFDENSLILIASHLYKNNVKTPAGMDDFIKKLSENECINPDQVADYIEQTENLKSFIKKTLSMIGLTRQPTEYDVNKFKQWRNWGFSDDTIIYAFSLSLDKLNPYAYVNAVLSQWMQSGIFSVEKAKESSLNLNFVPKPQKSKQTPMQEITAKISSHYSMLRSTASLIAQNNVKTAESDKTYSEVVKQLSGYNYDIAKARYNEDLALAESLIAERDQLNKKRINALKALGLTEADLSPVYKCKKCNDTGYLADGKPCSCYTELLETLKKDYV